MIYKPSMCSVCANASAGDDGQMVCTAFPNGVPDDILRGNFDHRNEYPDDRGIRFERDLDAGGIDEILARYDQMEPAEEY